MSDDMKNLIDWLNTNHPEYFNIFEGEFAIVDIKKAVENIIHDKERFEVDYDELDKENYHLGNEIDSLESEVYMLEGRIADLEEEIEKLPGTFNKVY